MTPTFIIIASWSLIGLLLAGVFAHFFNKPLPHETNPKQPDPFVIGMLGLVVILVWPFLAVLALVWLGCYGIGKALLKA